MLIGLNSVSFSFGEEVIFKDVNLEIYERDRIALIGPNGAGKTTLLNLITSLIEPEEGSLSKGQNVRVGYLRQNGGLSRNTTIEDEMQLSLKDVFDAQEALSSTGMLMAEITNHDSEEYQRLVEEYHRIEATLESLDGYNAQVKINTVLNGMGFGSFDVKTPVETMSGGERTRLMLCKLLVSSPDLLILDEATNHLDFKMLAWLEEYLSSYKGAVLTVSHDRYFLDRVTTKTWEIENLSLVQYPAPYSKYLTLKEQRLERLEKQYEKYQNEVARLQEYADKNMARASTSQSAKSRLRMIEHLDVPEKPYIPQKPPIIKFAAKTRPVSDILMAENLVVTVGDGSAQRVLVDNQSVHVKRGEKIAIIGENGAGKSTLLRTLTEKLPPKSGTIEWGRNVRLSTFEQDSSNLSSGKAAIMELWDRFPSMSEREIRTLLGGLQLKGDEAFKSVGVLSGGERARIKLAILMLEQSNVLVLDEPTNHLDIDAKEVLQKALMDFEGTVILVSHDRYLLNQLPTRILQLENGELLSFEGQFEALQQFLSAQNSQKEKAEPKTTLPKDGKTNQHRTKAQRSAEVAAKKRFEALEASIFETEQQLENLQQSLLLEEVSSDFEKLCQVTREIEEVQELLENYYQQWNEFL